MNTQPAEQQLETLRALSKEFATALADTQKAMKEEFDRDCERIWALHKKEQEAYQRKQVRSIWNAIKSIRASIRNVRRR